LIPDSPLILPVCLESPRRNDCCGLVAGEERGRVLFGATVTVEDEAGKFRGSLTKFSLIRKSLGGEGT